MEPIAGTMPLAGNENLLCGKSSFGCASGPSWPICTCLQSLPLDGTIKSARDSICLFQDFLTGNSYDQEKKTGKQEKGKGDLYGKICFTSLHHL
jgi:hypothetical protein